jgi:hypothetical protein
MSKSTITTIHQVEVKRAIVRNLFELAFAIYERRVLKSIEEYDNGSGINISGVNFILICHRALFNDMVAHLIKVLDTNARSATFWMIKKYEADKLRSLDSYTEDKVSFLQDIAKRIKPIRDKTHFHIDKKAMFNPKAIWQEAAITRDEYDLTLENLWGLLTELHQVILGGEFIERAPDYYKGDDVAGFLDWARSSGLIVP